MPIVIKSQHTGETALRLLRWLLLNGNGLDNFPLDVWRVNRPLRVTAGSCALLRNNRRE